MMMYHKREHSIKQFAKKDFAWYEFEFVQKKMFRFSISNSFQVAIKLRIANTPKRD